jgi:hypothetical protein
MWRVRRFVAQLGKAIAPAATSEFLKTDEESQVGAKIPNNKSARKYGPGASKKVAEVMHEFKHGTLRSGRSKKRVTNPKQAIAIGISEARRAGSKVPPEAR